jgi:adenine phosphoribosyltransferase
MVDLKAKIREIPDFPKKGILFYDIGPLLENPKSLKFVSDQIYKRFKNKKIDKVVAVDARGFIFGALVVERFKAGLVLVRKKGKLPYKTENEEYGLEYGKATLEIHKDSIQSGEKVLIIDDLLATGGTVRATCNMVEKLGGKIVGVAFLIELAHLKGRKKINEYDYFNLITYNK